MTKSIFPVDPVNRRMRSEATGNQSRKPLTPPETINFMAAGPEIFSGVIFCLGTK